MADGTDAGNGAGSSPVPDAQPQPNGGNAGAQPPDAKRVELPLDAFNARLRDERSAGERAILKALGVERLDDARAVIRAAKDLQDASLSEKDKLAKSVDELRPKAEKADRYESIIAAIVEEQFAALPEQARKAIDDSAKGNAEDRLRLMQVMRAAGLIPSGGAPAAPAGGTPTAPAAAAPANTSAAPAAPKPSGGAPTKWDEYQARIKGGDSVAASIFYQANRLEIERTKPAA